MCSGVQNCICLEGKGEDITLSNPDSKTFFDACMDGPYALERGSAEENQYVILKHMIYKQDKETYDPCNIHKGSHQPLDLQFGRYAHLSLLI